MWKRVVAVVLSAVFLLASASADQDEFCAGFAEGYMSVKGDSAKVPSCPNEHQTPHGSSSYREGIKIGIRAARKKK